MIPEVTDITTHIEPTVGLRTRSEAMPEDAVTEQTAREIALAVPGVRQCHELRMLRARDRLLLSIRCALDEDLTTIQAHDISTIIEEHVKRRCAHVDGVFVHVEPFSGEISSSHS
jgi:divalent metal cation (Fe/Co/Zn/Cd) transporter